MAQQNQGPGVSVSMAAIIDQLHQKYGATLARLMQENAELQAAVDALTDEVGEARSRLLALSQGGQPGQGQLPLLGGQGAPLAPEGGLPGLLGGPNGLDVQSPGQ